jgi:hypothetical protein
MATKKIIIKMIPILKNQGVLKASLFGSFARGDETSNSDIDLLVKFARGKTLLDLIGLKLDLEKKLGKKIDILTYDSIHPFLKDRILKEQQIIYEKKS